MERELSILQAASIMGLSPATIRNWIRLGYLTSQVRGRVTLESLERVRKERVGESKLISRANKQHMIAKESQEREFEVQRWHHYEESLGESHRNREGVYYTPEKIVSQMLTSLDMVGEDLRMRSFLDPCCGSGNFIIEAIKRGVAPENIYGYDIDPRAVEITKYRIEQLTGYRSEGIICGDFLSLARGVERRFDYIYTNPPWGKKHSRESRTRLAHIYGMGRSTDSSSLFLIASLGLLKDGGELGFLLQEALFNITSYRDIRKRLLEFEIVELIEFARPFRSLLTRACAVVVRGRPNNASPILCTNALSESFVRTPYSFECNPNLIFNMWSTPQSARVIEHLLTTEHITLKGHATWGLGVVSGDNGRFCRTTPREGDVELYRGSDIVDGGFKPPSLYFNPDLSLYQQSAPRSMYESSCKIVYRFIGSRPICALDREGRYTLNSANFFILERGFPLSAEQLRDLLNSNFMGWYFRELFNTRKILRRDLESLPIVSGYFRDGGEFREEEYLHYIGLRAEGEGYRVVRDF